MTEPTSYRRAPGLRVTADGAVVMPGGAARPFFPTAAQQRILQSCASFKTARQLATEAPLSGSDLRALAAAGLLETDRAIIEACLLQAVAEKLAPIADLGILTCASPPLLRRSVESWHKLARHCARDARFIVVDDSPTESLAAEQRQAAQGLGSVLGAELRFVDPQARAELGREIAGLAGVDPALLEFALAGREPPRVGIGGNRNVLNLLTQGRRLLSADDDVVAEFSDAVGRMDVLWITSADVPLDTWFFDSIEEMQQQAKLGRHQDPFRLHESFVGRSVGDVLDGFNGDVSLVGASPALTDAMRNDTARIAVSALGLAGDGASDCLAFFSMLAAGQTRNRLFERPDPMSDSREIMRRAAGLALCQGAGLMTFCHATDNSLALPPYFPVGRGEDQVWQKLIHWSDPATLVAHLPLAVLHRPATARRYSEQDFMNPFAKFPGNAFLLGAIESCAKPYIGFSPDQRLDWLGDYFESIAGSSSDFSALVEQAWRAYLEHHRELVDTALETQKDSPRWWVRHMIGLGKTLKKQVDVGGPIPLEYASLQPAAAVEALRIDVSRFSELLRAWPDIRRAARVFSDRLVADPGWMSP